MSKSVKRGIIPQIPYQVFFRTTIIIRPLNKFKKRVIEFDELYNIVKFHPKSFLVAQPLPPPPPLNGRATKKTFFAASLTKGCNHYKNLSRLFKNNK